MTEGVNCGGGRRTRLTIVGVCSSGAPPHIYRLEGRRGSQGGAPSRRNPTWAPPNSASPLPYSSGGGRKEEGGEKEGGGRIPPLPFSLPPFPSSSYSAYMGGAAAHVGCCVSPLGPIGPNLCRGMPGTPSGDPIHTRYPRNTYGVRILSSYI